MKVYLIMIAIVGLGVGACASNNELRTDPVSGATIMEPAEFREDTGSSSRTGDTIKVTGHQDIKYIPDSWNGNPRQTPWYSGSLQGNQILIYISAQDGDPDGPDWKPSPTTTASFEILKSTHEELVLKSLDSNLKIEGSVVTFRKV